MESFLDHKPCSLQAITSWKAELLYLLILRKISRERSNYENDRGYTQSRSMAANISIHHFLQYINGQRQLALLTHSMMIQYESIWPASPVIDLPAASQCSHKGMILDKNLTFSYSKHISTLYTWLRTFTWSSNTPEGTPPHMTPQLWI